MKKRTPFIFVMVSIFILIAGCQPKDSPASPLSAALSELSGKVDSKQAGDEPFAPANTDTALEVNGQIQTGNDGRVRLDLSSGTIIRVAPSSLFTLTSNNEVEGGLATNLKLDIGKIFIILNGGSADVETPSGVASVRGSYMKVEVNPETMDIYVTCLEGNCSASNPAGTVNFTNGQRVVLFHRDPVTGNWTAPYVEPMTPAEFQEWLDENPEAKELFDQAMATMTAMALPTEPPTEAPTAPAVVESVVPPAGSSSACFNITQPAAGASLPKQGRVTFEWETQIGAQNYVITFTDKFGNTAILETSDTSISKYIEILPNGGEYSWHVTSYGADGNVICSTESASFSKPQGDPLPKPPKVDEPDPEPKPEPPESSGCPANSEPDGEGGCICDSPYEYYDTEAGTCVSQQEG